VLDRIRHSLEAAHSGAHPRFTVSFGVTDSDVAVSMEQMLQFADAALYRDRDQRGSLEASELAADEQQRGEDRWAHGRGR